MAWKQIYIHYVQGYITACYAIEDHQLMIDTLDIDVFELPSKWKIANWGYISGKIVLIWATYA